MFALGFAGFGGADLFAHALGAIEIAGDGVFARPQRQGAKHGLGAEVAQFINVQGYFAVGHRLAPVWMGAVIIVQKDYVKKK